MDITTDSLLAAVVKEICTSENTASRIQAENGLRQSVTILDEHCVRHIVIKIHDKARRTSRNAPDKRVCNGGSVFEHFEISQGTTDTSLLDS